MVRFLGVASLLLFSHIALVAADAVPAVRAKANDIFMRSFYAQRRAKIMGAARQAPKWVSSRLSERANLREDQR
ncbi:hypothetical protein SCLCIDRAFT_1214485 [Scleroderma citrinum Foug A]|uniref:Uncharacterized protein n=1 Tax=Scleroderma citrinum Foug A TaxID=1036808 RepID=A0A0C3DR94_9AGAM|nr:hypothetical protein SCLCIDRAFT_1214485 [Scleroderma citrinum Foug A]